MARQDRFFGRRVTQEWTDRCFFWFGLPSRWETRYPSSTRCFCTNAFHYFGVHSRCRDSYRDCILLTDFGSPARCQQRDVIGCITRGFDMGCINRAWIRSERTADSYCSCSWIPRPNSRLPSMEPRIHPESSPLDQGLNLHSRSGETSHQATHMQR